MGVNYSKDTYTPSDRIQNSQVQYTPAGNGFKGNLLERVHMNVN